MSTLKIKDTLIDFLKDSNPQQVAMGLGLLLERIRVEAATPNANQKMMPIIFEYLQGNSDDPLTLRIIAWLLLLDSSYVANYLAMALSSHPNHSERLVHTFLLLGKEAEDTLFKLLQQNTSSINPNLKAEVAGILGMMTKRREVRLAVANYALSVSRNGYGTTNHIANVQELAISLRALGGLLAGGRWKYSELEELQHQSPPGTPQRELLDILLGKLYTPIIKERERELAVERQERQNEKKEFEKEIRELKGELKVLQGNYRTLTSRYQTLEANNTSLLNNNSNLQTSNDSLQTQNQILRTRNSQLSSRITNLEMFLRLRGLNIP